MVKSVQHLFYPPQSLNFVYENIFLKALVTFSSAMVSCHKTQIVSFATFSNWCMCLVERGEARHEKGISSSQEALGVI